MSLLSGFGEPKYDMTRFPLLQLSKKHTTGLLNTLFKTQTKLKSDESLEDSIQFYREQIFLLK